MAAIRPRDLLSDGLLERLGGTSLAARSSAGGDTAAILSRDIGKLGAVGYLKVALPPEFGGLGCTLRQAACGQRRLARHAPLTALAVSAHLYWTGAAADAYRAGDDSARWILLEAARGALFAAGHGATARQAATCSSPIPSPGASPPARAGTGSATRRCSPPSRPPGTGSPCMPCTPFTRHRPRARPDAVLAFAGRGSRCTPAFRIARVQPAGSPADVFTTSAIAWGHSILASVQYSDARRAFNAAVAAVGPAPAAPAGGHPLDQWPVAEAGLRLDGMKAKIAEITHPWPLVPEQAPDLGGQRLISIFTMRHEVAEGAARVLDLVGQIASAPAVAAR